MGREDKKTKLMREKKQATAPHTLRAHHKKDRLNCSSAGLF
jgi:hypothetical protein